jgi:hypothetical protein
VWALVVMVVVVVVVVVGCCSPPGAGLRSTACLVYDLTRHVWYERDRIGAASAY